MVAHITVLIDDLFRSLSKLSQCYCLWFLVVRSLVSMFFVFLYDLPLSFSPRGVVKNYKQVVLGPRAVLAGFSQTAFFLVLLSLHSVLHSRCRQDVLAGHTRP